MGINYKKQLIDLILRNGEKQSNSNRYYIKLSNGGFLEYRDKILYVDGCEIMKDDSIICKAVYKLIRES